MVFPSAEAGQFRPVSLIVRWGPVAAWMAAIFLVSGDSDPSVPGGMPASVGHVIAYMGLGLLVLRALAGGMPERLTAGMAAGTLAISIGYGITDEIHQWFVPGRTADVLDVAADAAGALLAVATGWGWGHLRRPAATEG